MRDTLLGGQPIPVSCLLVVFLDPLSVLVHDSQVVLSDGVASLGPPAKPLDGSGVILRNASAVAQNGLGQTVSLLGRFPKPLYGLILVSRDPATPGKHPAQQDLSLDIPLFGQRTRKLIGGTVLALIVSLGGD